MRRRFCLQGLGAAGAILAGLAQLAHAADTEPRLPLGLYQIDRESTMGAPDGSYSMHSKVDGASGQVVNRNRVGAVRSGAQAARGAPQTHCVSSVNMWRMPKHDSNAAQCTRQATRTVDGKLEHRATCPHGNVKLTLRQLDARRWEYLTEVDMGSKETPPNLMFLKPALKDAIVRARTPLEKQEAERRLAALESQQNQMVDKRSEAIGELTEAMQRATDPVEKESLRKTIAAMGGTVPMKAVAREIWTRIADTCAAPPQ